MELHALIDLSDGSLVMDHQMSFVSAITQPPRFVEQKYPTPRLYNSFVLSLNTNLNSKLGRKVVAKVILFLCDVISQGISQEK